MEVFTALSDDHGKRDEVELLESEMEKRREQGWYIGEPPVGLKYDDEKHYLQANDDFDDVRHVFELRDRGYTYREIAEEVSWSPPTIGKLLKRRDVYEAVDGGAVLGYHLSVVRSTRA